MKYGKLNLGQIEAVVNKMGGMEGIHKFLSGETIIIPNPRLKIWRRIEIGGMKDKEYYLALLKENNIRISEGAKQMIKRMDFEKEKEREVDLVKISVGQLGCRESGRLEEIYKNASKFGLELCPFQTALELCLQENGFNIIYVGMKPIVVKNNDLLIFSIGHSEPGGAFWLQSSWAVKQSSFLESDEWIFALS